MSLERNSRPKPGGTNQGGRRHQSGSPRQQRRNWSTEAKAGIVAEALMPGVNVSAIARAHGIAPQQVFAWRRRAVQEGTVPGNPESRENASPLQADANAPLSTSLTVLSLPVAAALFQALDEAGVRYGIVRNLATLPDALAGRDDVDLLVDKQDYPAFCAIVNRFHGLRGVSLSCHDNVCAGREDWFVPDFSCGGYLHLDTHIGVRVGWKFRKRYLAFDYSAITGWQRTSVNGVSVPVVSPEDEIRIAIARFAFRAWALPWRRWVAISGDWKDQLAKLPAVPGEQGVHVAECRFGRTGMVSCRIRQEGDGLAVDRRDLTRLRHSIRQMSGFTGSGGIADPAVHLVRKISYRAVSVLGRLMPRAVPAKRRLGSGGIVVALVGPDGLGKSTQVDRLTKLFRWKFGCAKAYLGTGEGTGWWLRKVLQRLVFRHRRQLKAAAVQSDNEAASQRRGAKQGILGAGLAVWGVLIAIERYAVVKRAHRWATRGLIVICDRWPQARRSGYLDGPMIPPKLSLVRGLAPLARLEQKLYQKMEEFRPHLTLHLVSDHAVSDSRKPGEISKEAFDARLSLMAELRALDKDIRVVDASSGIEAVNRELFRRIWLSL
ncbi:transposase [Pseudaminobacter sp. 19-2017]|uniref:Transposase n=2 Tax=Pseudaminobacter soli (ex Zhang et al. 2022) TaxID=2831468 RepID=A0A942IBJ9_9HYPH|nr:transposase [Pseudaminobacter soli]MBS3651681.1 transposase [Pseudaminobacter soli]